MAGEILKIKNCIPPLGANILLRPRISDRLNSFLCAEEGFTRKLTIVSAPAGYGKTTAVRGWLKGREKNTTWLSLDEEDNNPERFWTYLLSALENLNSEISRNPLDILHSKGVLNDQDSSIIQVLTPLLNNLFALETPSFLVIDDYHLINEKSIHHDLAFFIENLPPTLHLVITTRSDPPWPLSAWRAKQFMTELRMAELRFTDEETAGFFKLQSTVELKEVQLNTLLRKTEGWVTGLKLAAYSLASSSDVDAFISYFAGSHRHVLLFLSEEVYNNQREEVKDFLTLTSILDRFTADLCDTITGTGNSGQILEELERENLFIISLDEEGTWFRYHPLFTDLLQHKLKTRNPDLVNELHERAGNWFLDAGEAGEAVRHAFAAGNILEAVRILHDNYSSILLADGPLVLNRSLKAINPDYLECFPKLVAHMALFKLIETGRDEAEAYLQNATQLSYDNRQENDEYQGILNAVRAYFSIFTYNFGEAVEYARTALDYLPSGNYYWRMNVAVYLGDAALFSGFPARAYPYYREAHQINKKTDNRLLILTSNFKMATCLYFLGRIDEAEQLTRGCLLEAREKGLSGIPRTGLLWTLLGEIQREKGMFEEAERCIERGLLYSEPEKPCLGWNLISKIALHFSQKEPALALDAVRDAELLNSEVQLPSFVTAAVERWKCRLFTASGDYDSALKLLSASGIKSGGEVKEGRQWRFLALAHLIMESRPPDLDEAGRILEQVERLSLEGEYVRLYLEVLLTRALLEEKSGFPDQASKTMLKALRKGHQLGFLQVFRDAAGGLPEGLSRVKELAIREGQAGHNELVNYINTISGSADHSASPAGGVVNPLTGPNARETTVQSELVEPLTAREVEILELIKEGHSNESIAKTLYLSLGTVKWHTTNIYGKLGVRRRTEAVAQARKLRLIS